MRMPNTMTTYSVRFVNGTTISLVGYNENQARLLAQHAFPEWSVASVIALDDK